MRVHAAIKRPSIAASILPLGFQQVRDRKALDVVHVCLVLVFLILLLILIVSSEVYFPSTQSD